MALRKRIKRTLHLMSEGKILKYASVRCGILSECIKPVEEYLDSKKIHYTRLIDPDLYLLETVGASMYESGSFLGVVEVKTDLSRTFYLLESDVPMDLGGIPGLEFTLAFRVRKKEGLYELFRIIGEGKIGGIRHKHRSTLNFLISLLGGVVFSSVMELGSYLMGFLSTISFALIVYLILDYPFSLLYFKGVEVVSTQSHEEKVLIVKIKRPNDRGI
ncbi:hypothetical protein [Thermococcus thioreducens]|uniref:Uncharacterized protein n=1 Tax=Thermococcus thioreducens TaxID=277988 RepID=A0A0Q2MPB9_9EURY|nr:hypothetical protein [Thermococcus thioreducens]ASJ12141.1 hypothetical protein A3L14_04255 [Thermococcus thioreducens]KQH81543.1 hypothetical protein AMR53_10650 [Thermococcus thioreducens]SEV96184.1 hypothetical protein SAMN05216170_1117 [Thermococcus thioreducens]